jgi:hypothetical protein
VLLQYEADHLSFAHIPCPTGELAELTNTILVSNILVYYYYTCFGGINMAQTSRKVNFMINDDVRKEFERLVPSGERSKVANEALRKELNSIKRKRLTERLLLLRSKQGLSTNEIVAALKKDRTRGIQS